MHISRYRLHPLRSLAQSVLIKVSLGRGPRYGAAVPLCNLVLLHCPALTPPFAHLSAMEVFEQPQSAKAKHNLSHVLVAP